MWKLSCFRLKSVKCAFLHLHKTLPHAFSYFLPMNKWVQVLWSLQSFYFQTITIFTTTRNKSPQQTLMVAILWCIKLIYAYNQNVFPLIIYAQQFNIIICATILTLLPSWLSTLKYKHTHICKTAKQNKTKKQYPSEAGFILKNQCHSNFFCILLWQDWI